ALKALGRRDS
nr:unnamed protein product [Xenopus laevis]